jgi:hypothetical protein
MMNKDNVVEMEFEYDIIDELLSVNTSSAYHFEKEQSEQAQREWSYQRAYSQAFRKVQEAEMHLDIVTAEIVEELFTNAADMGSPLPPSSRSEIRRSKVPVDERWQTAKREWISANEHANIMSGAIHALRSKGFRLNSIQKMVENQLFNSTEPGQDTPSPKVTNRGIGSKMAQSGANMI